MGRGSEDAPHGDCLAIEQVAPGDSSPSQQPETKVNASMHNGSVVDMGRLASSLPEEILANITKHICTKDLLEFSKVCRAWYDHCWRNRSNLVPDYRFNISMQIPRIWKRWRMKWRFVPLSQGANPFGYDYQVFGVLTNDLAFNKKQQGSKYFQQQTMLVFWNAFSKAFTYKKLSGIDFKESSLHDGFELCNHEKWVVLKSWEKRFPFLHIFDVMSGKLVFTLKFPKDIPFAVTKSATEALSYDKNMKNSLEIGKVLVSENMRSAVSTIERFGDTHFVTWDLSKLKVKTRTLEKSGSTPSFRGKRFHYDYRELSYHGVQFTTDQKSVLAVRGRPFAAVIEPHPMFPDRDPMPGFYGICGVFDLESQTWSQRFGMYTMLPEFHSSEPLSNPFSSANSEPNFLLGDIVRLTHVDASGFNVQSLLKMLYRNNDQYVVLQRWNYVFDSTASSSQGQRVIGITLGDEFLYRAKYKADIYHEYCGLWSNRSNEFIWLAPCGHRSVNGNWAWRNFKDRDVGSTYVSSIIAARKKHLAGAADIKEDGHLTMELDDTSSLCRTDPVGMSVDVRRSFVLLSASPALDSVLVHTKSPEAYRWVNMVGHRDAGGNMKKKNTEDRGWRHRVLRLVMGCTHTPLNTIKWTTNEILPKLNMHLEHVHYWMHGLRYNEVQAIWNQRGPGDSINETKARADTLTANIDQETKEAMSPLTMSFAFEIVSFDS